MRTIRVALAQMNPTVGAIDENAKKIIGLIAEAKAKGADLVAFPELALTGYPPEDLLLKPGFINQNLVALDRIREHVKDIAAIVGFVDRKSDIYNAGAVIADKKIFDVYHKIYLPNYGVFDEFRYFQAGKREPVYKLGDCMVGINICEDIWYPDGPARRQALSGAELIININASPYTIDKRKFRESLISMRASDNSVAIAYLNMVGGQDELVFDGGSLVVNESGEIVARARQFKEELLIADIELEDVFRKRLQDPRRRIEVHGMSEDDMEILEVPFTKKPNKEIIAVPHAVPLCPQEEVYNALLLGVKDYVRKNGFKGVVIGLSGGADSALVATLASDALGHENVTCIFMPSRYSSGDSRDDSIALVNNLGVKYLEIPIEGIFENYLETLREPFKDVEPDVTEENIQARIRGNLMMAFSNKFSLLVLTTGNKSEMSVGYATLYGDMAGGFAVIKDVPKTLVYDLLLWRNQQGAVVPERILTKEPTAELRPNQKDTDSLPPYSVLDPVLKAYIEEEKSIDEIDVDGCNVECVKRVMRMVDSSEYKRRQSPPGIKITQRAFGRDRRFPITNGYRG